jgi:hypothetical protein
MPKKVRRVSPRAAPLLCRVPRRAARGRAQPSARVKNPFNKKNDNTEIEALEWRIVNEAPPRTVLVQGTEQSEAESHYGHAKLFSELPLSSRTLQGLSDSKFVKLTEIQRASLPQALAGRDVLGTPIPRASRFGAATNTLLSARRGEDW